MNNIQQIMKQAQQMQSKIAEIQKRFEEETVEGSAGAGMVSVVMNCKGDVKQMKIDAKAVDPEEIEMLEDLIVAALNDAKSKADKHMKEEMSKATGGIKLPF